MVNTFLANFLALSLSSANRMYSSLKVNIAEGSIPIKGQSAVTKFEKMPTFVFAIAFASSRKPLEIKALPLSS